MSDLDADRSWRERLNGETRSRHGTGKYSYCDWRVGYSALCYGEDSCRDIAPNPCMCTYSRGTARIAGRDKAPPRQRTEIQKLKGQHLHLRSSGGWGSKAGPFQDH